MYKIIINAIAQAKIEQEEGINDPRRLAIIITKLEEAYGMYQLASNSYQEGILDEKVEDMVEELKKEKK